MRTKELYMPIKRVLGKKSSDATTASMNGSPHATMLEKLAIRGYFFRTNFSESSAQNLLKAV